MAEEFIIDQTLSKKERYENLLPQINELFKGEKNLIANLANLSAALKSSFNFLWVGFYLLDENNLVLGPFQGPVACTRIEIGKGVCGTAFREKKTIIVEDINLFEGHIVCSSDSRSEIVVPLYKKNALIGVLDIDSEHLSHFDEIDQTYLEKLLTSIQHSL